MDTGENEGESVPLGRHVRLHACVHLNVDIFSPCIGALIRRLAICRVGVSGDIDHLAEYGNVSDTRPLMGR